MECIEGQKHETYERRGTSVGSPRIGETFTSIQGNPKGGQDTVRNAAARYGGLVSPTFVERGD